MLTREPGGSPGAEALREVILSGAAARFGADGEALLFSAARIDHIDATIAPALRRGDWVVCDRFADSTRAYQGAAGQLDPDLLASLERVAVGACRPDLTLILDLPADEGLARAAARRGEGGRRTASRARASPFTRRCGAPSSRSRAPSRSAARSSTRAERGRGRRGDLGVVRERFAGALKRKAQAQ